MVPRYIYMYIHIGLVCICMCICYVCVCVHVHVYSYSWCVCVCVCMRQERVVLLVGTQPQILSGCAAVMTELFRYLFFKKEIKKRAVMTERLRCIIRILIIILK